MSTNPSPSAEAQVVVPTLRRELHFTSMADVLADSERVAGGPHRTLGNWHLGQICEHLAVSIENFYDGFTFLAPWWARKLIAPLMKKSMLTKPMRPGFQLPKQSANLIPPATITVEQGVEHLRCAVARMETESPRHPHPFLVHLSRDEHLLLMLRHAELHLSFAIQK